MPLLWSLSPASVPWERLLAREGQSFGREGGATWGAGGVTPRQVLETLPGIDVSPRDMPVTRRDGAVTKFQSFLRCAEELAIAARDARVRLQPDRRPMNDQSAETDSGVGRTH